MTTATLDVVASPPPAPAQLPSPFAAALAAAGAVDQACFLLSRGGCPRCCLRFAGCRDGKLYASRAPCRRDLLADLAGAPAAATLDTSTPCSLCLGVLQVVDDGGVTAPPTPKDVAAVAAAIDIGAGEWTCAAPGAAADLARAVDKEGHADGAFCISLSYPASAAVRSAAAGAALAAAGLPPSLPRPNPHAAHTAAVVDIKDAAKMALTPALASALSRRAGTDADADVTLSVCIHFIHPQTAREAASLPGASKLGRGRHLHGKRRRPPPNIDIGKMASSTAVAAATALSVDRLQAATGVPPPPPAASAHVLVRVRRLPVYIGGYYLKHERDVSQSPFFIDGERKGRTSVQEEIERHILPLLRADGAKFVTAGREDLDVRCLGDGRPFVLDVANARAPLPTPEALAAAEAALTAAAVGVGARRLAIVPRSKLGAIKEGETTKRKSYRALVELPVDVSESVLTTLSAIRDLVLKQTTPTRVEHRRAMMVRERTVVTAEATPDPAGKPRRLELRLTTQAGLYVKEFVHGDGGRTVPNVSTLLGLGEGTTAECLELDVERVHMEFL